MPKPILLEVMKARAGIPTNDLFAMLWAKKLRAGSSSVQTLTGIPPLSFKSNGTPLISWSMKGNGSQSGTPTPDNPIQPEFVGVETANLFDKNSDTINNNGQSRPGVKVQPGTYSIDNTTDRAVYYRVGYDGTTTQVNAGRKAENIIASDDLYVWRDNGVRQDGVMLNLGSTALQFEPFGYKIQITCGGQTTPVYLGEVQTVRKIRKLVLTGEESYTYQSQYSRYIIAVQDAFADGTRQTQCFCTHYQSVYNGEPIADVPDKAIYINMSVSGTQFCIKDEAITSADDFKSFLAQQYANGNPVTIWYILAEAQTGISNEPLAKIGDYCDELSSTDAAVTIPTIKGDNVLTVDTPIQPSEMSITYKG